MLSLPFEVIWKISPGETSNTKHFSIIAAVGLVTQTVGASWALFTISSLNDQVGGDTWSTYVRPSGSHLLF